MNALVARFVAWAQENSPVFWLVAVLIVAAALLALLIHALSGSL